LREAWALQTVIAADKSRAGLITRESEPVNLESPFDQLDDYLTPNNLFYIRNHFEAPRLDDASHELKVEGAVEHPFAIGMAELRKMPAVTRTVTLECAGNGRVFLSPPAEGVQWQLGAVSTAEWTGVPLTTLLERAGLLQDVSEIVLDGADKGTPKHLPKPTGEIRYARSIGLEKAKDVLVAYAMNGEELTIDHGFPVRAIVPGHYGMASVKWLAAIHAMREPFRGYWQTSDYAYWDDVDGNPVLQPLGVAALKSAIARPRTRESIAAGQSYRVFGAAWCGELVVDRVEISTDDGATWQAATLLDPECPNCWRRWEFQWHVPEKKGTYILKSRAWDTGGNMQPEEHDRRFGSYVIHHTVGIEVNVA
jgi:DMSO/TMAO reductase YedYZ molybdopterin-dependent catalytic subunit